MNRRAFLKSTCATLLAMGCASTSKPSFRKPNFLFILVDDLGWTDLGCFGSSFYETPNIDRLCKESMKFTNAYASPVSSPTRSSILSGKYPARLDTTEWFGGLQPEEMDEKLKAKREMLPAKYKPFLPLEEITIAEALNKVGYSTFFAGKWHLGESEQYWPKHQGFDINKGGWSAGGPYGPGKYFVPYGNPRLEDGPEGEHLPDRLANETIDFIKDHRDKPFFAYLSFYSVHTPLVARDDLVKKYKIKQKKVKSVVQWTKEGDRKVRLVQDNAVYAAMIESMDMACGKVLSALKKLRLKEDTVVIFFSDNGGLSTSEGHPTSNLPLRAGKGWLYEGGVRVPMIVRWPGVTKSGSLCNTPVSSTDFYPTILDIVKLGLMPNQHVDGASLVPLLRGKKMDRGAIYWHYPHYSNQGGTPSSAIRDKDWKLIKWYEDDRLELYNLRKDISESMNVADIYPDIVDRLHEKLKQFLYETNAKMPSRHFHSNQK